MPDEIQIITTGDGSHSLLNTALNETYHSVHGAKRESIHVFLDHGLDFFNTQNSPQQIRIFEVGFGTGLNALLTATYAQTNRVNILYTSIEAFPLGEEIFHKLNYAETLEERDVFAKLHSASWNSDEKIKDFFTLRKINTTLEKISLIGEKFDVVYFDAFAPSKQPELWELSLLEKVCGTLKKNGVFVTYCAKGQLKRDLKSIGLEVQTLPGPPGKKEMVRGLKI
jgi:tRNA U34 5-methylaminomethyl-2-thiouridine-forming methyltransferase MnmC